jgi:hypothetical protein
MNEAGQSRKLAAILAADVVGYSRLMAPDDSATVHALNECRAVFRERIERHDGQVIDMAGDSVLAEFRSVVEAARCAMEVQAALRERNRLRITVQLIDATSDAHVWADRVDGTLEVDLQDLWHRLLGWPVSEFGRLCRGDGSHEGGDRRRWVLMLAILLGPLFYRCLSVSRPGFFPPCHSFNDSQSRERGGRSARRQTTANLRAASNSRLTEGSFTTIV